MRFLERFGALFWFLLAAAWFLASDLLAMRAASGLASGDLLEPVYRLFLLFLLVLGYSGMSRLSQWRTPPRKNIGLDARSGWKREWALGAALGWAGVVACILPTALIGGLVITVFRSGHQVWVALLDLIALLAGTLAIELAFRGFGFRRLVDAMGPGLATIFMAVVYAIWRTHATPTSTAAVVFSFLLGWVLALAALRTRALWVGWGFHFTWAAVMSVLFGLPIAGGMSFSPVLATNAVGPAWVTGGLQGPEGSAFGVLVGFALVIAMVRATSDLKYRYGFPEIVPGGIPVDLDAAARRQHEEAQAHAEPAAPALVQILPVQTYPVPLPRGNPEPAGESTAAATSSNTSAEPAAEPDTPDEEPPEPEATGPAAS